MESLLGVEVFLAVIILILYILTAELIEKSKCDYMHETTIAIGLGMIGGLGFYFLAGDQKIEFSTGIFFYFVLPPIVFAAGYTLKSRNFFLNFGFIALYGFLGTFFSFLTLAIMAIFFNENGAVSDTDKISTKDCLLLASVLSATDTVAAITVVKESKFPRLHSILFGEGVMNDAVAIVLFRTVAYIGDEFDALDGLNLLLSFLYMTGTSILIGLGFGLLAAYILKKFGSMGDHPDRETAFIILMGYMSYIVSELLDLSGIMAIFVCGVTMAHYAWHNLSRDSQQGTNLVFSAFSQGAEALTFTYLGMTVTTTGWEDWNILFLLCMFVAMVVARAASIFMSSAIVYLLQWGHFGLDSKSICVAWFTGLIRGAIAFALVLQIESEHQKVLVSTTLGIALLTTICLTNLLSPYTRFIGLESSSSQEIYFELMSKTANTDDKIYTQTIESSGLSWFHRNWQKIDEKYLTPIFGGMKIEEEQKKVWDKLWADDEIEINKL